MAWRTHRKIRSQSKEHGHVEEYHVDQDVDINGSDAGGKRASKRFSCGWRWKRILHKVGWIQIPSGADEEMHGVGTLDPTVTGQPDPIVVPFRSLSNSRSEAIHKMTFLNKHARPTDVPSFENLGGYRYGDYGYGPDNMSPLPIPYPLSSSFPRAYQHWQPIAEVEAPSLTSSSPLASPIPDPSNSSNTSLDSSYGLPLTSYNGFLSSSQDDMTAALPIPKDHPLCQHHPGDHRFSACQLPKPTGERNLAARKYEYESLVPKPLRWGKRKEGPAGDSGANGDRDESVNLKGKCQSLKSGKGSRKEKEDVNEDKSLEAYRGRRRSRVVSAIDGAASKQAQSRYSHFQHPLSQHPVEAEVASQSGGMQRHSAPQISVKPAIQVVEDGSVAAEWHLLSQKKRKCDSIDPPYPSDQTNTTQTQDDFHPKSRQPEGKGTKESKQALPSFPSPLSSELKIVFENPPPPPNFTHPSSLQPGTRSATAPAPPSQSQPRPQQNRPIHPPALQIGKKRTIVSRPRQRQNRHFSVCDGTWTAVPLTPIGRSYGNQNPERGTLMVEEVGEASGRKRAREE